MSTTKTKVLICPYCGDTQAAGERCRVCGGLFEPFSRQASHNAMGPWFVRDEKRPFQPGASYETIVKLIERGQITRYTILRTPTTKQFWTVGRRVPGIAHLLGYCHNCDATVSKDDHGCPSCGVPFGAYLERNYLGLPEVKLLPWEAPVLDEGRGRMAMPGFHPLAGAPGAGAAGSAAAAGAAGGAGAGMAGAADDFRRAAEPLGLSSFASDDELRGLASRPPYHPPSPPTPTATPEGAAAAMNDADAGEYVNGEAHADAMAGSTHAAAAYSMHAHGHHAHAAHEALAAEPRGLALDSANSVAARALQRRLQRQQHTIRLLMIVLGAVAIISVVVILAMLARFAQKNDAAQGEQSKTSASGEKAAANGAKPAAAGQATAADQPPAQPLDTAQPPSTLPGDDPAQPPVQAGPSFKEDHERAGALIIEAKKEDRALKDRIKDADAALALLRTIKAKAPAAERPATLDQEITEAERLVERLKLLEFFP